MTTDRQPKEEATRCESSASVMVFPTFTELHKGTSDAKRLMEALHTLELKLCDCKHLSAFEMRAGLAARRELVTAIVGSLRRPEAADVTV